MTTEDYYRGLGCSPDEVEVCSAASRARFGRELRSATQMFEQSVRAGFVSHGDPDDRVRSRARDEDREVAEGGERL